MTCLIAQGDAVAEDEVVGEIETDKVSVKFKLKLNCNVVISCLYTCTRYYIFVFLRGDHYPRHVILSVL